VLREDARAGKLRRQAGFARSKALRVAERNS